MNTHPGWGGKRTPNPGNTIGRKPATLDREMISYRPTPEQKAAIVAWLPRGGEERAAFLAQLATYVHRGDEAELEGMTKGSTMSDIVIHVTDRGFARANFDDLYGSHCSIQESSLGSEQAIWLGVHEGSPEYKSQASHRMHLNQKQVKALLPLLKHFAKHGNLPRRNNHA